MLATGLVILIAFFIAGVPIYISMTLSVILAIFLLSDISATVITLKLVGGLDKFALLSMPFYIFGANIMAAGGLSKRIVDWALSMAGSLRGGLAITTQLASMFFGALCGSSPATVASIGKMMYPRLRKDYGDAFSLALLSSSGAVAIIIPPSIALVVYGAVTGASIGSLFIAGVIPGIVFGVASILYCWFYAKRNDIPRQEFEGVSGFVEATREASWALGIPLIILGGIYLGIFTPTEAAGVSATYAIFVSMFIYKELTLKQLIEVSINSSVSIVMVMLLVAGASTFGWFMTISQVPQFLTGTVLNMVSEPWQFLLLLNLVFLIAGMFMDGSSAIIILAPLVFPIGLKLGIDPIHLGIVITANLAIGMFTPPFGLNLFVASDMAKVPVTEVIKGVLPFVFVSLVALMIITYLPEITVFLPNLVYGN